MNAVLCARMQRAGESLERIELEKNWFMNVMQQMPVGPREGGSFNAYFAWKLCDAAYYQYRERFLARKYGPSWIVA